MKQDEIIEMAVQAGIAKAVAEVNIDIMEAFAKLVDVKATAREREACAKVCEDNATDLSEGDWDSACNNCADHIRARGGEC